MSEVMVFVVAIVIPVVFVTGGCVLIGMAIYRHTRLKELAFRERLALIEKGLVPPEGTDPATFDRLMHGSRSPSQRTVDRGIRMRTAGVLLLGVGLGLAVLISLAGGNVGAGLGVGGGIAILGMAFLVNGLLTSRYPVHSGSSSLSSSAASQPPDRSTGL